MNDAKRHLMYFQFEIELEIITDNNYAGASGKIELSVPRGCFDSQGFVDRTRFPHTAKLPRELTRRELASIEEGAMTTYREVYSPKEHVAEWLFANLNNREFVFRESHNGAEVHFRNSSDLALFRLTHDCTVTITTDD